MSKYGSIILIAILIMLVIAFLLAWPNVIRDSPLVFGIALVIGIVIGILTVVLRGGPQ